MSSLIHDCFAIIAFFINNPGVGEGSKIFLIISLVVDFIESHPVFDFILITLKNNFCKAYKEVNHFTVFPATILSYQMIRHFKVRQSDNRLNTILEAFVKKVIIKLQTSFIRLYFISFRENPRPGNRSPETLEAHLCKKSNISLVTMIKINGLMVRIVLAF